MIAAVSLSNLPGPEAAAGAYPRRQAVWPPAYPDPFPESPGIPEITGAALSNHALGGGILHHGGLIVRELFSAPQVAAFREAIDRAFDARDAYHAGTAAFGPWYTQHPKSAAISDTRPWVEEGGGVWTADSPRVLEMLLDAFRQAGIIDLIEAYMGERPALSIGKSTLRRVPITSGTDWHQDGAFLGDSVRAVNLWVALSDCGQDSPGLDIVAKRLPYVVQSGTHGSIFHWAVGPRMVEILAEGGAPVISPTFAAGDAMLFDHLLLHRTGVRPGMTESRWAIESWFFAPSAFPMDQVPLEI